MSDEAPPFVTSARECIHNSPRAALRHATLSVFAALYQVRGIEARALSAPRVQILNMHYVFDDQVAAFAELITELSGSHTLISYSEAVRRIYSGHINAPYIAFTFDDGQKSCLNAGDVLLSAGVPGCFFVCPGIVGERRKSRIAQFCRNNSMPISEFMDWEDLALLKKQGHEIGSHTMTHLRLSAASDTELEYELGESYSVINRHLGAPRHFAWPFGRDRDFSPVALECVFHAGYESCASGVRGCHTLGFGPNRRASLKRDNIVAGWPLSHIRYFLTRNVTSSGAKDAG